MHPRFPILHLLDQVRGAGYHPFASDPDAVHLERRAGELISAYCGDMVWLTGNIAEAPLSVICAALERTRPRGEIRLFATAPESDPVAPTFPAA